MSARYSDETREYARRRREASGDHVDVVRQVAIAIRPPSGARNASPTPSQSEMDRARRLFSAD